MAQQTIPQIINDAQISEYLSAVDVLNSALFPKPVNKQTPLVIYTEYKSVQWAYNQNPPVVGVNANGEITILSVPINGFNIIVHVLDPILGSILLGSYTKGSGDTTTTILATSIKTALSANTYGYPITSSSAIVNVQARNGLGSTINGANLVVTANTTPETKAKAFFTPTRQSTGTLFTVTVTDPNLGVITVGTYTQQSSDTTDTIFIANLVASINIDGYTGLTSGSNGMYVVAASGLGATINGNASEIAWIGGNNNATFSGGVNAIGIIPNTLTQFSGGVTAIPPSPSLVATSNYLYWLCGAYNLQAINIRTQGGGGSIAPITPPSLNVNPIEFIVSNSSPIANGGNTLSIPSFIGLNVIFNRNNIPQSQINNGSSWFSWNKATGIFTVFGGNAVTSEDFHIIPTI